jgi:hypothetical protein
VQQNSALPCGFRNVNVIFTHQARKFAPNVRFLASEEMKFKNKTKQQNVCLTQEEDELQHPSNNETLSCVVI